MFAQVQYEKSEKYHQNKRFLTTLTPNKPQQKFALKEQALSSMKQGEVNFCKYDEYMQENIQKNVKKVQQNLKKKEYELEQLKKQNEMTLKKAKTFLCPKHPVYATATKLKPKVVSKKQKANIEQKHYRMITDYMTDVKSTITSQHNTGTNDTCPNQELPITCNIQQFCPGFQFINKENEGKKEGNESWIVSKILIDLNECDGNENKKKNKEKSNEIKKNLQNKKKAYTNIKFSESKLINNNNKEKQSKSLYNNKTSSDASQSSLNNCLDKFQQVFQKAQELLKRKDANDAKENNYGFLSQCNSYYFSPNIELIEQTNPLIEQLRVEKQNDEYNIQQVFNFESFSIGQKDSNESQGVFENNFLVHEIKEPVNQIQESVNKIKEQENNQINNQLNSWFNEIKGQTNQIKDQNNEIKDSVNIIKKYSFEIKEQVNQIKEQHSEKKEYTNEMKEQIDQIKEYDNEIKENVNEIKEQVNEIKELVDEINNYDNNEIKEDDHNEIKEYDNNEIKQYYFQIKEDDNEVKDDLNEIKEYSNVIEEQLNEIQNQCNKAKESVEEKKEYVNEMKDYVNERTEDSNEIKEYNNEIKDSINEKKNDSNSSNLIKQQNNKIDNEIEQQVNEVQNITESKYVKNQIMPLINVSSDNPVEEQLSLIELHTPHILSSSPSKPSQGLILKNIINQCNIPEPQSPIKQPLVEKNTVSFFQTNKENFTVQCQSEEQIKQNQSTFSIYKIDEENEDEADSSDEFGLLSNYSKQSLTPIVEYIMAFQELIPDSTQSFSNELKLKLQNGLFYEGEITELQELNGYGTLTLDEKNLLIYEGQFVDNQFNGRGKLINIYAKQIGNGIVNFNNLDTLPRNAWLYYQGQFEEGKLNGYGVLVFNNDQKLHGQFVESKVTGTATIFDMKTNEAIFCGEYEQNQLICANF